MQERDKEEKRSPAKVDQAQITTQLCYTTSSEEEEGSISAEDSESLSSTDETSSYEHPSPDYSFSGMSNDEDSAGQHVDKNPQEIGSDEEVQRDMKRVKVKLPISRKRPVPGSASKTVNVKRSAGSSKGLPVSIPIMVAPGEEPAFKVTDVKNKTQATASDLNLAHTNELLLHTLECPVCFDTCTPPIYMCTVGHHICFTCRHKFDSCVTCKAPISNIRNWIAEKISDNIVRVPCKNASEGCSERCYHVDMAEHLRSTCMFSVSCLGDGTGDCDWRGDGKELRVHVMIEHVANMGESDPIKWSADSPPGVRLFRKYGEVFWCVPHYSVDDDEVYPHCRLVGPRTDDRRFTCEFKFVYKKGGDESASLTWSSPVLVLSERVPKDTVPPLNGFLRSLAAKGFETWFLVLVSLV